MFNWKRIVAAIVLLGLLAAIVTTASLYSAVTQVHPYYREALERPSEELEEQSRALELRRDLADDVDRLGLEGSQVRELIGAGGHECATVNPD